MTVSTFDSQTSETRPSILKNLFSVVRRSMAAPRSHEEQLQQVLNLKAAELDRERRLAKITSSNFGGWSM